MIDRAVSVVAERLTQHLRQRFSIDDDLVTITSLTDAEGKPSAAARNQLVLFVTNITHDTMPRKNGRPIVIEGRSPLAAHPIHLNVYLMLAANFDPDNYLESLKVLSNAIQFFQANPVFDPRNTPELDRSLEQLSLEISNIDAETLGQLWGTLGGRYLPSVQYKMRTVVIDSGALVDESLVIRTPDGSAKPGRAAGA